MILPTKHLSISRSLLGIGAMLLSKLDKPKTVTALWGQVHETPEIGTFEKFTLALDLLFILGAVKIEEGLVTKVQRSP